MTKEELLEHIAVLHNKYAKFSHDVDKAIFTKELSAVVDRFCRGEDYAGPAKPILLVKEKPLEPEKPILLVKEKLPEPEKPKPKPKKKKKAAPKKKKKE